MEFMAVVLKVQFESHLYIIIDFLSSFQSLTLGGNGSRNESKISSFSFFRLSFR